MSTKVLNLFAGLGGNRLKWTNCEVTAVELDEKIASVYKDNNPNDEVIIGDAMNFLKENRNHYDFIWASPPCQKHSKMMKATRHDVADFFDAKLWQVIVFLSHFYSGHWVVENVRPYYEPLIKPTKILGRHYIWSNFKISKFDIPNIKNFITIGSVKESEKFKKWLGIEYKGNIYYKNNHCPNQVLRNCVHPNFGLHIYECMLKAKDDDNILYEQTALNFDF